MLCSWMVTAVPVLWWPVESQRHIGPKYMIFCDDVGYVIPLTDGPKVLQSRYRPPRMSTERSTSMCK